MKKALLPFTYLLLALVMAIVPQKAGAQVTAMTAVGIPNYYSLACILPDTVVLGVEYYPTGTPPAGDSVTVYVNFDDGYDTTFKAVDTSAYFDLYHAYTLPGNYTTHFTVTTITGVTGSWTAATPLSVSNSCSNVSGTVYVDANSNCTYDAGDGPISFMPVWVILPSGDTTYGSWTDGSGAYAMNLPPNNYVLFTSPFSGAAIAPSCPATGTYSITATASGTYAENYAYNCVTPATLDMSCDGYANNVTLGDSSWAIGINAGDWWWGQDYTCSSLATTITLTLDPHLHYLPAYSHFTVLPTVSGNTLTFSLTTATDHFRFGGDVRVYCDLTAPVGGVLTNTITATPTSITDPDLTNNTRIFTCGVLASFDPNGIAVSPQGAGLPGYIPNNTPLSYAIHFQNTGTAAAGNITVNDTLDANLDPKTLHIISSSDPVEIQVVGNAVKFIFSGINLPDSTSSPYGSIGNIVYAVMPKSSLAPGTQIKSKASIYFDYNAAVVTNSTLNTILTPDHTQTILNTANAYVYPNPADNTVYAKTDDKSDFTMTITDMLGRTITSSKSVVGNAVITTESIPAGLYIVTLTNSTGKVLTTKVAIQH